MPCTAAASPTPTAQGEPTALPPNGESGQQGGTEHPTDWEPQPRTRASIAQQHEALREKVRQANSFLGYLHCYRLNTPSTCSQEPVLPMTAYHSMILVLLFGGCLQPIGCDEERSQAPTASHHCSSKQKTMQPKDPIQQQNQNKQATQTWL